MGVEVNMNENCYFFVDGSVPEDEQKMAALCEACHDKYHQELGWFWPGASKGYGPYDIICTFCKKVIHKADKKEGT